MLNIIPEGWQNDSVGHLIVEQRKSQLNVADASGFGLFPFFTSGDMILRHNDSLVDGENLYLADGGVADIKFYDGPAAYSNHTYTVRTTDNIDTKFLYYCLTAIRDYINNNYFQGTGLKNLQKKDFKKHELCFPKDKEEQRRIVDLLTKIDNAIAETKSLIEKYDMIKTGLMQDLMTKGIDEKGCIRSEKTHKFKDSESGRIPSEWNCQPLGRLFDLYSGITPSRARVDYFNPEGTNWVKTLDLNEDYLGSTEEKISNIALEETSIRLHPENTLLIAMYGGWIQIGRTAILAKPATTNQAIVAFYPKGESPVPIEFLQYYLQVNKHKWKRCAISTRKDPNISKKDISEFLFAFPSNFEEAQMIVERINEIKHLLKCEENTLLKFQQEREGLLNDLLSGKIRIPSTLKI